jgi:nucleoid-associated protein YgaU
MSTSTNKKKGRTMRTVYRNRRIAVLVIPFTAIISIMCWSGLLNAPIDALVKAYDTITTPAPEPTCVITSVTVKEGDTLWGIAERYCPDHFRTGETVSKIIAMNNGIVNIHAGQVINLPFKKGEK